MQLQDPFPIDSFPRNVRMAILAEFAGRCPSVREAIGIPDAYWLTVPGVGPRRLAELRRTLNAMPAFPHAPAFDGLTDAELVAERERLHRESRALRGEIASRRRSVRAVSAELIRRGMTDPHQSDAREQDDLEGS